MSIWKAFKIWEAKKASSDFKRIKVNSSGSFHMKSKDLFNDKDEVNEYVRMINESLNNHNKNNSKKNLAVNP